MRVLQIHPDNPQPRLIRQVAALTADGGLIAYPTDSSYAFGWAIGHKRPAERVARLRQTDQHHVFTLVCRDLADIAAYARVDNVQYRLLKAATPGPFTFVLPATRELPRRLQNPRRRTVGIRIPDHPVAQALLAELSVPMMSSTLLLPGAELPLNDANDIAERIGKQLDLIVDAGPCSIEPTTVIDLSGPAPELLRQGRGDAGLVI